jgi:hypothetical protein
VSATPTQGAPPDQQPLHDLMVDVSGDCCGARWLQPTEYTIWRLIVAGDSLGQHAAAELPQLGDITAVAKRSGSRLAWESGPATTTPRSVPVVERSAMYARHRTWAMPR